MPLNPMHVLIGEVISIAFSIASFLAFQGSNDPSTKLLCGYVFAVAIVLVHVFLILALFFTDDRRERQQASPPQAPPESEETPKQIESPLPDPLAPRYEHIRLKLRRMRNAARNDS
jgi:hypothetical protein